jgi:hypothetical protein
MQENKTINLDEIAEVIAQQFMDTSKYDDLRDLVPMTIWLMKMVEKVSGLTGDNKKSVVMKTVNIILSQTLSMEDENYGYIATVMLDSLVDNLVSVDKGHIQINSKAMAFLRKYFKPCFQCFFIRK